MSKLTERKIKKWVRNTLVFSSPALLAVLIALQGGRTWEFALGAGYSALIASVIDAIKKYQEKK